MEIDSKKDLRMVSRAMRERWDVDREKVVAALQEVVDRRDPKLMIEAAKLLMKADEINTKREELELKETSDRRLRLLELAQRIPAREIAKLASDNGFDVDEHEGI